MSQQSIYLDYAAATPLDPRVLEVMQPYLTERYANPSSLHAAGRQQRQALEAARQRIATTLGAKPTEISFTGGSTEGINLAIQGVMANYPGGAVVVAAVEHAAVLAVADHLAGQGHPVHTAGVSASGIIDIDQLGRTIDDQTVLLAVQYVNNETGVIQPLRQIKELVGRIRSQRQQRGITRPLYWLCDAAQAGLLSLQVSRLGLDLMTMGGSKLYGPAGSGLLYARTGVSLQPILFGGGQERGLRSGTPNVAAAVGLAESLALMQDGREAEQSRLADLRDQLWNRLSAAVEGLAVNGDANKRLPGYLNFSVAGAEGEEMVARLDAAGLAVATGAACSAANQEPSHVLLAIGLSSEQAAASLRLSLGRSTTKEQVERAADILRQVLPRVRRLGGA